MFMEGEQQQRHQPEGRENDQKTFPEGVQQRQPRLQQQQREDQNILIEEDQQKQQQWREEGQLGQIQHRSLTLTLPERSNDCSIHTSHPVVTKYVTEIVSDSFFLSVKRYLGSLRLSFSRKRNGSEKFENSESGEHLGIRERNRAELLEAGTGLSFSATNIGNITEITNDSEKTTMTSNKTPYGSESEWLTFSTLLATLPTVREETDSEISTINISDHETIETENEERGGKIVTFQDCPDSYCNIHSKSAYFRFALLSNIFFVLGSVLYLWLSIEDYHIAYAAHSANHYLLWARYYQDEQEQQKADILPAMTIASSDDYGSGGGDGDQRRQLTSPDTYEDYEWKDLPRPIRSAAMILGYNKVTWDYDEEVAVDDLSWEELTREQQGAAILLGYSQATWDDEDDDYFYNSTSYSWGGMDSDINAEFENQLEENSTSFDDEEVNDNNSEGETGQRDYDVAGNDSISTYWGDYKWSELPHDIQGAASTLGYNDYMWDNSLKSSTSKMDWADLTNEQRQAAFALGYDQSSWGNGEDGEENSVRNDPAVWEDYSWFELPNGIQSAASTLGYNAYLWNNDLESFSSDMDWVDLSTEQKQAAMTLGYNQELWDFGYDFHEGNNDVFGINESKTFWDDYNWFDLPHDIQSAASVLGYDEYSWFNGLISLRSRLDWDELTNEKQQAATILGYSKETWDLGYKDEPKDNGKVVLLYWDNYYWADLPDDIQRAASTLGYNEVSWDLDLETYTSGKQWIGLTSEQRQAAFTLGYDQKSWDWGYGERQSEDDANDGSYEDGASEIFWDDYDWSDLPVDIQNAFSTLGYNEYIWNNDLESYTSDMYWLQLAEEQKDAANFLGYSQETWDFGSDGFSKGMILYVFAALSFVFVGTIDFMMEQQLLHMAMVLAGAFGLVSAIFADKARFTSNVFNSLSVHFFLLEALAIIKLRRKGRLNNQLKFPLIYALWAADTLFFLGAFFDVVLSYFYLGAASAWNVSIALMAILGALFWLACSLIYVVCTILIEMQRQKLT